MEIVFEYGPKEELTTKQIECLLFISMNGFKLIPSHDHERETICFEAEEETIFAKNTSKDKKNVENKL